MQKESDAHWTMAGARRWRQRAEGGRRSRSGGSDAIDVVTVASVRAVAAARGGEAARATTTSRRRVRAGELQLKVQRELQRKVEKNRAAQARRRRRDDAPVARRRRRKFQRALQAGGEFENGLSHLCCLQILHIHGSINSDEHVRQNIVSAEAINTCQAKGREAQGVTAQRSFGAVRKAIQGDADLKTLRLLIMKCAAHRA